MAILLVLLYHYTSIPPDGDVKPVLQGLFAIGWSGVDLFFILSGFLIGGILMDVRESPNYFQTFYARRFYRIVPLYYAWIAAYFVIAAFRSNPETWRAVPVYALFLQNSVKINHAALGTAWLGALWSLAVEEQFYLVVPAVIRWVSTRALPWLLCVAIIVPPALRVFLAYRLPAHPDAPYMLTACRADALAIGMMLAFGWRNERWKAAFRRYKGLVYFFCAALLGASLCLAIRMASPYSLEMYAWGFSVIDFLFATLVAIAIMAPATVWGAFCRLPFLREVGRVSYCMYVIHQAVILGCHELVFHRLPRFDSWATALVSLLAAMTTYGIAALSWRFLEHPLLRKGHAYEY